MKLPVILLAAASCSLLRADFSYQETTRIAAGPVQSHTVATHMIKGNRMASLSKDRISVIDLDKETITEIDLAKKNYAVKTFAQIKQATGAATPQKKFKVSAKTTGESKAVGVLNAKELLITMAVEGSGSGDADNEIVIDAWMATVPGFDDVKVFQAKLGQKLGYALGLPPEFEDVGKELIKVEGVPIQYTVSMGNAAAVSLQAQTPIPPEADWITGALDRLAGIARLGRKKGKAEPKEPPVPGDVAKATTELANFSAGPADASKFEVPAGFKNLEPPAAANPASTPGK